MTNDDKALVERLRFYATEAQLGAYYDDDTRQVDQAADRIEALSEENERLREALGWFLNDSRFVVQVGGNPYVVPQMIEEARARLGLTE